jgi:hypothetical protein
MRVVVDCNGAPSVDPKGNIDKLTDSGMLVRDEAEFLKGLVRLATPTNRIPASARVTSPRFRLHVTVASARWVLALLGAVTHVGRAPSSTLPCCLLPRWVWHEGLELGMIGLFQLFSVSRTDYLLGWYSDHGCALGGLRADLSEAVTVDPSPPAGDRHALLDFEDEWRKCRCQVNPRGVDTGHRHQRDGSRGRGHGTRGCGGAGRRRGAGQEVLPGAGVAGGCRLRRRCGLPGGAAGTSGLGVHDYLRYRGHVGCVGLGVGSAPGSGRHRCCPCRVHRSWSRRGEVFPDAGGVFHQCRGRGTGAGHGSRSQKLRLVCLVQ